MTETDRELLARYKQGDPAALGLLVDKYRRQLFGYILSMTGGQDEADEIFQEVWYRVIRKISLYRAKNFRGWIMRIAHNIIIDRARRRRPTVSLDAEREDGQSMGEMLPADGPAPSDGLGRTDLERHIARAVDTLPPEQKEVFLLRVRAELPFREIAATQRVSINTALARMQYALAKLRPLLKQDYEELENHVRTPV